MPLNADAAEVSRHIQNHAAQVEQWYQMVNMEYILKQQLLESLNEKYFKGQHQAYTNDANCKLLGLIQNLYKSKQI